MANDAALSFVKGPWDRQERLYRLLDIPAERQKYLTGNWYGVVVPPPMLTGGFPLTSWSVDEAQPDPSHYPHTCPRCSGPAYVGAVAVDCAGGCK